MSRLNEKDLKVLKAGGTFVVGNNDYWNSPIFGTLSERDHVEIHIYNESGDLIKSGKVSDFEIASSGNVILKPGDDLRKMGLLSGEYKVTYNFFRNLAGKNESVLVETLPENIGEVYTGNYWVNDDGIVFKGQEGDTSAPEELDVRDLKFFVQAISPSRTEIRLAPLDIKLDTYKNDFTQLYMDEKTYFPDTRAAHGRLYLQDPSTTEFTIPSYYAHSKKVNEFMVDGTLTIDNAFTTEYTTTSTSLLIHDINMIEPQFDWSYADQPWESSLHVDAVNPDHG